jgi:hypothetical protein
MGRRKTANHYTVTFGLAGSVHDAYLIAGGHTEQSVHVYCRWSKGCVYRDTGNWRPDRRENLYYISDLFNPLQAEMCPNTV